MDAILKHIFDSGTDRLTDLVDTVLARHKKLKLKPWPLGLKRGQGSTIDTEPAAIAESPAKWTASR